MPLQSLRDKIMAFEEEEEEKRLSESKGLLPGPAPHLKAPSPPVSKPELLKTDAEIEPPKSLRDKILAFEEKQAPGPDPLMPTLTPSRPSTPREPLQPRQPGGSLKDKIMARDLEDKGYKPVAVKGSTFKERAESFQKGQSKSTKKMFGSDDIGTLRHMSSSFMLGATNMIAAMPEYVAIAAKEFEDATGLFQRDDEIEDRAMYKLGQAMRSAAKEWFPMNEELAESFLYTVLPQGAGSLGAFMALGVAGKAAGLAAWVMPLIGGATMESANMYLEAKGHGATEDEAFGAWLGGHLAGALEAVPVGRALSRFDKISGGGVKKILANGFTGGVEELVQEVAQTMTENYVAKLTFDEQRELMAGTVTAGGAGGILGAVANMMIAAAGLRMHGGVNMPTLPTKEELEELGKTRPDSKIAWENYYATEERVKELEKSGKYSKEEFEEAMKDVQKTVIKELSLDPGLRAGGLTTDLVDEASKEKVTERAEQLAGRGKPEAKDKTEEDVIEVISKPQVERDPGLTPEKEGITEKEAEAGLDAHIEEQEGGPDLNRLRTVNRKGALPDGPVGPEAVEPQAIQDPSLEAGAIPDIAGAPVTEAPVEEVPRGWKAGDMVVYHRAEVEVVSVDEDAGTASIEWSSRGIAGKGRATVSLSELSPTKGVPEGIRPVEEQPQFPQEEDLTSIVATAITQSTGMTAEQSIPVLEQAVADLKAAIEAGGISIEEARDLPPLSHQLITIEEELDAAREEAAGGGIAGDVDLPPEGTDFEEEPEVETGEKATEMDKPYFVINGDGAVYSFTRGQYRKWITAGAGGKEVSDPAPFGAVQVEKYEKEFRDYDVKSNELQDPDRQTAYNYISETVLGGENVASHSDVTSSPERFQQELNDLNSKEKELGIYEESETRKERKAKHLEQNKLKVRNAKRLAELEENRTKKMQEDSAFIRELALEGRKFTTKKVIDAQEPGTRQTGRIGATWGVYENKKLVAHMHGKRGAWEVYEPVKGEQNRIIQRSFESRKEAFHAAVRLMAEPSTEVESEEKIEERQEATRKRIQTEKDKRRSKLFYVIARDNQVYAMKRGQYREWLEIGAAGKDNSDFNAISPSNTPKKKYAEHLKAMPEGGDVKAWLEESIGKPALSLEQATVGTFKEELKSLTIEEKKEGWYKDPAPEGVDPEAHKKAYKYYDVGTIEYELAIRGGIELPRNAKGKLTQEGLDMLLHNRKAKTTARQYDYSDPIYIPEENSMGGGSSGDIENIGDELIGEGLLAKGTSLTAILTGRVRVKKGEGLRGYPTLEKQNELADEANERLADEQSEEGKKRAELEVMAERRGFDLALKDRVGAEYNRAAQAEPEEAVQILSELEVELSDYINDSVDKGLDYKDANEYREMVREFIGLKGASKARSEEEKAKEISKIDTEEEKRDQAFKKLADDQRGYPEQRMLDLQFAHAGVLSFVVEHVGDITHRMSEAYANRSKDQGLEYAGDKVDKTLRTLTNPYGFEREHNENLRSNYNVKKRDEWKDSKEKGKRTFIPEEARKSFSAYKAWVKSLGQRYADAHRKLEVYSEPQRWARDAAVAIGEGKWARAITDLQNLQDLKEDPAAWTEAVRDVRFDEAGDIIPIGEGQLTRAERREKAGREEGAEGERILGVLKSSVAAEGLDASEMVYNLKGEYGSKKEIGKMRRKLTSMEKSHNIRYVIRKTKDSKGQRKYKLYFSPKIEEGVVEVPEEAVKKIQTPESRAQMEKNLKDVVAPLAEQRDDAEQQPVLKYGIWDDQLGELYVLSEENYRKFLESGAKGADVGAETFGKKAAEKHQKAAREDIDNPALREGGFVNVIRPSGWTQGQYEDSLGYLTKTEQRDDAEQVTMPGVEEIEKDNKLAKLREDEKKLRDLQKVKTGESAASSEFAEERGKVEKSLAESIKRQKAELSPKERQEQQSMFQEDEKVSKEEDEGTGGTVGGYYSQQTFLEEGPAAKVVPSRDDVPPPSDVPPITPPPDIPPPTGPTDGDSNEDLLQKARDAQIMPEDVKKAREEEDSMTLSERMRKLVTQLQTALTSQYTPFREAQKDIYLVAGEPLPVTDAATMAEINSGMDAKAMAEFYPFREEVIDQVKDDYMDFNTYIFLRRTGSRLKADPVKKMVGSWTVERTDRALEAMREEKGDEAMDHFEKIAEKYQEHADKMLDTIFATGIIDADSYDKIKADNDFYALFKVAKHFKSWDERLDGGGNITNDFKLLHAITGIQAEDVEANQIVDIVGETAKAIYNTKIRTEKQMFKMYLWEMAALDKNQKYFVMGRPDQYFIKQFKPAAEILEQHGLQRLAQNRQLTEPQMIKVGFAIEVAEKLGLKIDKKRMISALGKAEIGGLDKGGRLYLNAFISEVMIHELGHTMDIARIDPKTGETMVKTKKIWGKELQVIQRLSSHINEGGKFQEELKALVKMTKLGGKKKYRHSAVERFAEFMNVYVHNPALAHKIAPKWTLFFETEIMAKNKKISDTVEKLSSFYVKIDKLDNIHTKLEELGGNTYFETAVRKAFPDQPKFLALSKGTDIPEGFRRILLRVEGKQRALDVRADIYEALESLNAYQGAIAMKFLGKAGSVLRGGATVYNATFMVKNAFFRDPVRLALLSPYGINWKYPMDILRFPLDWIEAIGDAFTGNFGTPNARYMRWLKSGAGFTDMQSLLAAESLFEDKTKRDYAKPQNILNTIGKFASALEQSTKLLGFNRAIRMEKFDSLTPELQKIKLNEIAAEIRRYAGSPDFWRHGMKVKGQASLMFMFLNARIQGVSADLARLGSSSRGYQKEAWLNLALGVGLPTLGLAILNYGDDDDREYYEKQNKVERHNYYMIPKGSYYLDDNGDKRQEYWTIPKDDTAKIFSSMVESFVRFWIDEDPESFKEFGLSFFEDISPIGISGDTGMERLESAASSLNPVLKTPFEMMAARNFYYHTDVIPRRMENYAPEDQKRSTTPEIFVKLGGIIGESPLMLEHLTRNITASGLTQFAPLYDLMAGDLKIQKGRGIETALPVLKMFSSSSYGGTEDQLERLITIREAEGEDLGKRYWETEARFNEMQNMKPSQFSRELREIAKTDKVMAKAIRERKKKEVIGWNFMDGMVQSLGVTSGARARYIYGEIKEMNSVEEGLYIKELQKKRLLTGRVFQQVKLLKSTGGKEWQLGRRR